MPTEDSARIVPADRPPAARRIAFLCPRFAEGPTVGGAETLLKALARRLQAAGREVVFLTTCARNHFTWENEAPEGRREVDGLPVHFFPVDTGRDLEAFLKAQDLISRRAAFTAQDEQVWLRNSVNSGALCAWLRAHGGEFDRIVMGPYLFGLVYFAAQIWPAKTLLVPCLHDEGFAYTRAFRDMFRGVRGILFNAVPEMELAGRLYGLPPGKGTVVGMGMTPFDVAPDAFARTHNFPHPYVIYSGRREGGKGIPLLLGYLDLFRQRTGLDLKAVFTGTGPIEPSPALAPHILDLGFVSEEEKHAAMAGAVAFCHPSVFESFGIVVLESWLARTPVLVHARCAVNVHSCRQSGGGLWFLVYPEFEEALLRLLQDVPLRRAMGEAGCRYVLRQYDWQAVDRRLLDALDRL